MMKVRFRCTPMVLDVEVECVPRLGDSVQVGGMRMLVGSCVWQLSDGKLGAVVGLHSDVYQPKEVERLAELGWKNVCTEAK